MNLIKEQKDLAVFIFDYINGIASLTPQIVEEAISEYIDNNIETSEDRQYKSDQQEEQDSFDRELNG